MTAADLYAVFMRATRTAEPLPFEELPTVAQDGWRAVAGYVDDIVTAEFPEDTQ